MGYYHAFEDEYGNVRICDDSCEDPTCSDQFSDEELNKDDDHHYLGIDMKCDAVSR
jgi:hypothetical protein